MKMKKPIKLTVCVVLTLISIACILPFLIIVSTSLASEKSMAIHGYSVFPYEFCFDSYRALLHNPKQLLGAYGMSIWVSATGTLIGVTIMTMFAYAISRESFKFSKILSFFAYFTMLFSGGTVAIYMWISRSLRLNNNPWVLVLLLMVSAWNIFILRVSCKSMPIEVIESAKLDGCNELTIFFRIVVPMQKTAIATIALLMIFTYWNDWYTSMLYFDTAEKSTIQYYLVRVLNNVKFAKSNSGMAGNLVYNVPDDGMQMAICVLAVGPLMCVFPFFQKYFVSGIQVGSVKG